MQNCLVNAFETKTNIEDKKIKEYKIAPAIVYICQLNTWETLTILKYLRFC